MSTAAERAYRANRDRLQASSLARLRARIPSDCPLAVQSERAGFRVVTLDGLDGVTGRFQIVATWIDGFVTSWRRVRRS